MRYAKVRHARRSKRPDLPTIFAVLAACFLFLYLLWWMPARVGAGYVVPRISGSFATTPAQLPVIWIRAWPWQELPPKATVVLQLHNGRSVTIAASVTAKPGFYQRAVPATLVLRQRPAVRSTEVSAIKVSWPGGSFTGTESALWITAAASTPKLPGARVFWSTSPSPGSTPSLVLPVASPADLVAVSSPEPTTSPWVAPRCQALGAHGDLPLIAHRLLRGTIHGTTVACQMAAAGHLLIVAAPLRSGHRFYLWQPVVQELINKHLQSFLVGLPQLATVNPLSSTNWWSFAAAAVPPGF